MARVREPAVAGGFYPADPVELRKAIEWSFLNNRFGPGRMPNEHHIAGVEPVGGVVPHAGYTYSGPAAAHFYLWLSDTRYKPDTVVVIGTNHTGYGGFYTTTTRWEAWKTPLGEVPVDLEFVQQLLKEYPGLTDDPSAHIHEHSVEVQLPFLQYIYNTGFKLVPIVAKEVTARMAAELASAINRVAERLGRKTILIASSDFTHHGFIYGYVLFTSNVAENVEKLDRKVIDKILVLDTKGFLSVIAETGATVCGIGAIAALIEYAKARGAKAELLRYYNSAHITGEEDIAVGYASIAMYKEK